MRTVILLGALLIANAINPKMLDGLGKESLDILVGIAGVTTLADILEFFFGLMRERK